MHIDRDVFRDDLFHERNELLGDASQHHPRIGAGVKLAQCQDEIRGCRDAAAHRKAKKLPFRVDMSQYGRRRNAQLGRDVGERGGLEPLYCEDAPRGFEKLIARNPWRAAH